MTTNSSLRKPDTDTLMHRLRTWLVEWLRSFRTQVAVGFGGIATVLVVTLSFALGSMFAQKSEFDESLVLRSIARNAAKALGDGLTSRTREIQLLAASPTLWSEGLGSERVMQTISRTQTLTSYSAWIGAVSLDGVVQASGGRVLLGADVSQRPWFQEGKTGLHVGDVHPAKLLAALLPDGSDGGPQRFVDFSAPILREGRVIGVLGMHGSWEWTRSVVESLFPEDAAERKLEVFVLDKQDRVIYASDADTNRAARLGMAQPGGGVKFAREPSGSEYLLASAPVAVTDGKINLGWTVVAREPAEFARAAASAGVKRALALGLLAAMLAFTLGWMLAERLTRPLRQIAQVAKAIGGGRLDARIPRLSGSSEIRQLSTALAGMTARLLGVNTELEHRVKERTSALEEANAELDRQARFDVLTGLLNRRGMEERLQQVLPTVDPDTVPLGIVMVDIDHFKRVNDEFGHAAGDVVLQRVAKLLQGLVRNTDIAARMGGEEFVLMLPGAGVGAANRLAKELVEAVSSVAIEPAGVITISCGVTQLSHADHTVGDALRRADEALYAAKDEGRNRVVVRAVD